MKHTITINNKNTTEHIIHLDQHLPLNIKPLPKHIAYQIHNTPIITTTTKTLTKQTIENIQQKGKTITQPTHLIIIQNTKTIPRLQTRTIKENPQLTIHQTTPKNLHNTLQQILKKQTPTTNKPVTTRKNTLYHDNQAIKTYKNKEYLTLIKEILNNNTTLTLQEAEYQAQKQYYQYISYDKTNQNYKITLNKKTHSTHKKLEHAIQERNLQNNNTKEKEEETLCQHNDTPLEPIPPTPWNNNIHNTKKEHNKYQTRQKTRHNNPDTINHIHKNQTDPTTILNTQKPNRNINTTKKTYTITRKRNKTEQQYYKTHDIYQARYIRDKLEQHNYDKTIIPTCEQQYYHDKKEYQQIYNKKYNTIDYYQKTTTKLKQTTDTKEEYQKQQINKYTKNNRTP